MEVINPAESRETSHIPSFPKNYVADSDLTGLLSAISYKSNVVLNGPKGVGKSLALTAWAAQNDCPLIAVDCAEDSRRSALVGQFTMSGNNTNFILGPIPMAILIANSVGRCILVFEELSCLPPAVQKVTNSLLDFRKYIAIPEIGSAYSVKEDSHLWITGTMNNAAYGGSFELNEDLKSRFRMLPVGYPSYDRELRILQTAGSQYASLCHKLLTLANESRQPDKGMEYALSTRDLVQIVEDCALVGLKSALRLQSGKFDIRSAEVFKKRVLSIFDVSL